MKIRFRKILKVLAILLVVVLVVLVALGVWFVRRPWPQLEGRLAAAGLTAPVEVIRDEWGIPHIWAESEADLFFAQGYVHAQDRLWQMEFNRHVASGSLSAILGPALVESDRYLRTLSLRRTAEKDLELLDPGTRAILEAYAAGVNAFIDGHRGRLPVEYAVLGLTPEPWTPLDTLAWGRVLSMNLGLNLSRELVRRRLPPALGEGAANLLLPAYPADAPVIVAAPAAVQAGEEAGAEEEGTDAAAAPAAGEAAAAAALPAPGTWQQARLEPPPGLTGIADVPWGSNSWVVHGSRTETGKPLLANDTHLSLGMPSLWYENGLHGGRFSSVGFTFPGMPMVVLGHNGRIAWGITSMVADTQDLYEEKVDDPAAPTRYEFQGEWRNVEVVEEAVPVKGREPEVIRIRFTHHGPLVNPIFPELAEAEPLALAWTALEGGHLVQAVAGVNLATGWEEFRRALSLWDAPAVNFVYADIDGNIGFQSAGRLPRRVEGHRGLAPVPGWTGEHDWQGYLPFDALPTAFNPEAGFIVAANNQPVGPGYPHFLTQDVGDPFRAGRITEVLAADERLSLEEMRLLQGDTLSLRARALRPLLVEVEPEGELEAAALELVREWDLRYEADSAGAAVFHTWTFHLLADILEDDLGEELWQSYRGIPLQQRPVLAELLAEADHPWFDDRGTPEVEDREAILRRSLGEAVAFLSERLGDDPAAWQWGRLHTMVFRATPLGQTGIPPLDKIFNSDPLPAPGEGFTVDAATPSANRPFAVVAGVTQRFLADLDELGRSLAVNSTGQSAHIFHRHREDQVRPWLEVEYHPVRLDRGAVDAAARHTLILEPAVP